MNRNNVPNSHLSKKPMIYSGRLLNSPGIARKLGGALLAFLALANNASHASEEPLSEPTWFDIHFIHIVDDVQQFSLALSAANDEASNAVHLHQILTVTLGERVDELFNLLPDATDMGAVRIACIAVRTVRSDIDSFSNAKLEQDLLSKVTRTLERCERIVAEG